MGLHGFNPQIEDEMDAVDQNRFIKIRIFLVIVLVSNRYEIGLDVIILHQSHLQTYRQYLFVLS